MFNPGNNLYIRDQQGGTGTVKLRSTSISTVKKLVGLPPQLELLADSVTSQVHDNLFKLAHTESTGMHRASLMQRHTDTNS